MAVAAIKGKFGSVPYMSEILPVALNPRLRDCVSFLERWRSIHAPKHHDYSQAGCLWKELGYSKSEQWPSAQKGGILTIIQVGWIKGMISVLNTLPKAVVMGISIVLILGIGTVGFSLPASVSLLIFYLIPVVIATWFVGLRSGVLAAVLSAISIAYGQWVPSQLALSLWNGGVAGVVGCVVADLIHRIKISSEIERQLSRTDASTGAINRRFFMELLEAEFNRAKRYRFPLTLVYIELDNLAEINQRLGFQRGDELLYQFVEMMSEELRSNDVVARLSNDEFAMILPQTNDAQAQQVFTRILPDFKTALEAQEVRIECIFGVMTFLEMPEDFTIINDEASKFLEKVKASGQSRLAFEVRP
jgi:diguanylate cyclase (GGDEF)-like protein